MPNSIRWRVTGCASMADANDPRLTLAVDTSASVQVGLASDSTILAANGVDDSRRHVEQLTPLINTTLSDAGCSIRQVATILVGVGPGPFTGLRVGIATARALGAALGVDVRGVCSLDVLAAQWWASNPASSEFVICSDARRRELYWARYGANQQQPAGERLEGPRVSTPDALPALPVGGPGTDVHSMITAVPGAPTKLDAGMLAMVGARLADAGIEPLYLRSPDAAPPGRRKSVLSRGRDLGPKAV